MGKKTTHFYADHQCSEMKDGLLIEKWVMIFKELTGIKLESLKTQILVSEKQPRL